MATFYVVSLCIVASFLWPVSTKGAKYNDGQKVFGPGVFFCFPETKINRSFFISRYLYTSTKLDHISTHRKPIISIRYLFAAQKRYIKCFICFFSIKEQSNCISLRRICFLSRDVWTLNSKISAF